MLTVGEERTGAVGALAPMPTPTVPCGGAPFPRRGALSLRQRPESTTGCLSLGFDPKQTGIVAILAVNLGGSLPNHLRIHVLWAGVNPPNSPTVPIRVLHHNPHILAED